MRRYGIKVDRGRSYVEIERVARTVREVLAPAGSATDPLPGMKLFESLDKYRVKVGDRDFYLSYAVVELPVGTEALTRYDAEKDRIIITLSSRAYADLEQDVPRARFSLGHEIGHAVLHPVELIRLSEIPHYESMMARRVAPNHAACVDSEWQANALAAALLMPARGLAALQQEGTLWSWNGCGPFRRVGRGRPLPHRHVRETEERSTEHLNSG